MPRLFASLYLNILENIDNGGYLNNIENNYPYFDI